MRLTLPLLPLLLLLLTGCAGSGSLLGEPVQQQRDVTGGAPPALADVNRSLRSGAYRIHLTDGSVVRARRVVIGVEETAYRGPHASRYTYLSTSEVARVRQLAGTGWRSGALTGAIPGLTVIGAGLGLGYAETQACPEDPAGYCYLATAMVVGAGLALTAAGTLVGGLLSSHRATDQYETRYQGPVERYLPLPDPDF